MAAKIGANGITKKPFRSGNLGSCNKSTFYSDPQPRAKALQELGRPDSDVTRMMQKKWVVSGAPVDEPYPVGHSMTETWGSE